MNIGREEGNVQSETHQRKVKQGNDEILFLYGCLGWGRGKPGIAEAGDLPGGY